MHNDNQDKRNLFLGLAAPLRFSIVLLAVALLFMCIEILPLHFGPQHIAWPQMWPEIIKRLPRIALIGAGVALVLTIKSKPDKT